MSACKSLTKTLIAVVAIALALLQSCSNVSINLPPITESATGNHQPGRVIWHDLLTPDLNAAKQFYGELFGWQFKTVPMFQGVSNSGSYTLILLNGSPIGGLIDTTKLRRDVNLTQWVSVFASADIEATVKRVQQQQGTVYTAPTSLGERGEIAIVADSQGALFAVLQTQDGDPPESEAALGGFLWNELWTEDVSLANTFYRELFNYQEQAIVLKGSETYKYFSTNNKPRAAVVKNPIPDLDPTWVTFLRVENPEDIVARVPALGGEVLLDVQNNPIGGKLAIIRDPSGAGFVIQTWEYKSWN